ncbi:hypothetical protein [Streptomyces malaysiensis]|nr:hypothetical protein [Streptomyces autolyticus]
MRWAGWGVITESMPAGLWAACHPDYRDKPFPHLPARLARPNGGPDGH